MSLHRTATGHALPYASDVADDATPEELRSQLALVYTAMTVEDGTLTMAELVRLDRRREALRRALDD